LGCLAAAGGGITDAVEDSRLTHNDNTAVVVADI
jgi:hypothetical protein